MKNDELLKEIILLLVGNLITNLNPFWTIVFLIVFVAIQLNKSKKE
jgi:hypothetical protein